MQIPGDGTTGHSALELQEIVGSSTQRPQEAETGGLVGGGVESTGRGVYQHVNYLSSRAHGRTQKYVSATIVEGTGTANNNIMT
jgi:hypothetical protein